MYGAGGGMYVVISKGPNKQTAKLQLNYINVDICNLFLFKLVKYHLDGRCIDCRRERIICNSGNIFSFIVLLNDKMNLV
jgi:plasmid rolling circle replication initiator protein Rep